MSVNIDSFKRYTEYLANKKQSGNSLTPKQFNEAANRAQMQVFEKDRAVFISEGIAHNALFDVKITAECFSRLMSGKNLLEEFKEFSVPEYLL